MATEVIVFFLFVISYLFEILENINHMCTAVEETIIASILAVVNTSEPEIEIRPKKNSGPYGIWTHDLCDISAVLYQLSWQANWELVIMLDPNKPSKWWIMILDIWNSYICTVVKKQN